MSEIPLSSVVANSARPQAEPGSPGLQEILPIYNQISSAINALSPRDRGGAEGILALILEGAVHLLPETAAVLYPYDPGGHRFVYQGRISSGAHLQPPVDDSPRPHGFGVSALQQRTRQLSYEQPELALHPTALEAGARSLACFPLIVADQPVGVLYLYRFSDALFTELDLSLLDGLADHAAMALFQTRRVLEMQQELARKEDELSRLGRAGLLISSRLGLQETLDAILRMALEVTGAHYGIFRLVDPQGSRLVTRAVAGLHPSPPQVEDFPVESNTVMGWVARHRQPLCIHDLQAAPWNRIYHPLYADLRMRSELAVPLVGSSGRLEGVLNLESPQVGAFGEGDSLLLMALASQAVIAIQEARLLDTLLQAAQDLLLLPGQPALDRLVEQARDLLNAADSALWTLEGDTLRLRASSGAYEHSDMIPLNGSLTGQAVATGRAVISEDLQSDPRFHRPDLARRHKWARALLVPVLSSDRHEPIGALGVYSVAAEPGRFTESEWDEKVLTCIAYYVALALHTTERQDALRAIQERQAIAETFAAVGDIAANVLHHLNNKVGTIPVRIQGIEDKCSAALSAEPYLDAQLREIKHSAQEALTAVRESLFHLRPIHTEPVAVASCVASAIREAALPLGVRVRSLGLESLPLVMAGRRSLTLLFTNLIENASNAMQGRGVITMQGTALDRWVEVAVADDGPGIPPSRHERIFEFDASARGPQRSGQLGFGLWWVKTLLVRLGGSIAVESDGQEGTTFRIRLPRATEDL